MKNIFLAAVAVLVLAAAPMVYAASASYEVVCAKCYVTKGAHGEGHAACAVKCVTGGGALALLRDKKLYIPVDEDFNSLRDQFKPEVGKTVSVDGKVESKGGVNYLVVETPKK
ncbi:MAG: hypothetical protein ACREL1_05260 [bacterium]